MRWLVAWGKLRFYPVISVQIYKEAVQTTFAFTSRLMCLFSLANGWAKGLKGMMQQCNYVSILYEMYVNVCMYFVHTHTYIRIHVHTYYTPSD